VLLLNREPPNEGDNGTITISLRHYAIQTKVVGLPKALRRLRAAEKLIGSKEKNSKKKALPNLGGLEDVADYLLDTSVRIMPSGKMNPFGELLLISPCIRPQGTQALRRLRGRQMSKKSKSPLPSQEVISLFLERLNVANFVFRSVVEA